MIFDWSFQSEITNRSSPITNAFGRRVALAGGWSLVRGGFDIQQQTPLSRKTMFHETRRERGRGAGGEGKNDVLAGLQDVLAGLRPSQNAATAGLPNGSKTPACERKDPRPVHHDSVGKPQRGRRNW
jgi:hypothetical protein